MKTFTVKFYGNVYIESETIPVKCEMEIQAKDEQEAKDKAYKIAKNAYIAWHYEINSWQ